MAQTSPSPLISVVVLNYNGGSYLAKTLQPLFEFHGVDYEVVLVDNGSTDDSLIMLNTVRDPRLRVIDSAVNLGYGKGKNLGVRSANGEYVLLLDEDILISDKTLLQKCFELYQKLPTPGFISFLLRETNESDSIRMYGGFIRLGALYQNRPRSLSLLQKRPYHPAAAPEGGALFFRRELFEQLGGYDVSQPYYMDVGDLGPRAWILGHGTYIYNQTVLEHLGTRRKQDNTPWIWKYGYHFSGFAGILIKNFNTRNLVIRLPLFFLFSFIKTVYQTACRKDFQVVGSWILSVSRCVSALHHLLEQRRRIQSKRVTKQDNFIIFTAPLG